jgi:hypothetical protein
MIEKNKKRVEILKLEKKISGYKFNDAENLLKK